MLTISESRSQAAFLGTINQREGLKIMADFCKQCSIELFGDDNRELANLGNGKKLPENMGWPALCEDCGPILVDDDGICIDPLCKKHGYTNPTSAEEG